MRPLTEAELRDSFVNTTDDDIRQMELPVNFFLAEWDHLDFFAWADPKLRGRGYIVVERDGAPVGVMIRAAQSNARARAAMCNLCHTMQPADQVAMFGARKAAPDGIEGNSIGTYICRDLSCHENVRIAGPLAPSEVRASVDRRIDGTRRRTEAFVASVAPEATA